MLQFMGSQRAGHNWATKLNRTELETSTLLKQKSSEGVYYHISPGWAISEYNVITEWSSNVLHNINQRLEAVPIFLKSGSNIGSIYMTFSLKQWGDLATARYSWEEDRQ